MKIALEISFIKGTQVIDREKLAIELTEERLEDLTSQPERLQRELLADMTTYVLREMRGTRLQKIIASTGFKRSGS